MLYCTALIYNLQDTKSMIMIHSLQNLSPGFTARHTLSIYYSTGLDSQRDESDERYERAILRER